MHDHIGHVLEWNMNEVVLFPGQVHIGWAGDSQIRKTWVIWYMFSTCTILSIEKTIHM